VQRLDEPWCRAVQVDDRKHVQRRQRSCLAGAAPVGGGDEDAATVGRDGDGGRRTLEAHRHVDHAPAPRLARREVEKDDPVRRSPRRHDELAVDQLRVGLDADSHERGRRVAGKSAQQRCSKYERSKHAQTMAADAHGR